MSTQNLARPQFGPHGSTATNTESSIALLCSAQLSTRSLRAREPTETRVARLFLPKVVEVADLGTKFKEISRLGEASKRSALHDQKRA